MEKVYTVEELRGEITEEGLARAAHVTESLAILTLSLFKDDTCLTTEQFDNWKELCENLISCAMEDLNEAGDTIANPMLMMAELIGHKTNHPKSELYSLKNTSIIHQMLEMKEKEGNVQ